MADRKFSISVIGDTSRVKRANEGIKRVPVPPIMHELAQRSVTPVVKWDMRTGKRGVTSTADAGPVKKWSKRDDRAWDAELQRDKQEKKEAEDRAKASVSKVKALEKEKAKIAAKELKDRSQWEKEQERWREREAKAEVSKHKAYMRMLLDERRRIQVTNVHSGKWFKANVSQVHDAIGSLLGWRAYRGAKWVTEFMSQWEKGDTPDIVKAIGGFGKHGAGIQKWFENKFMSQSPATGKAVGQREAAEGLARKGVTSGNANQAMYHPSVGYTSGTGAHGVGGAEGAIGAAGASGSGIGTAGTGIGTAATTGGVATGGAGAAATAGSAATGGAAGGAGMAGAAGAIMGPLIVIAGAVLIISELVKVLMKHSEGWQAVKTTFELTLGSILDYMIVGSILIADLVTMLGPGELVELVENGIADLNRFQKELGPMIGDYLIRLGERYIEGGLDFWNNHVYPLLKSIFNFEIPTADEVASSVGKVISKIFPWTEDLTELSIPTSIMNFLFGKLDLSGFELTGMRSPLSMFEGLMEGKTVDFDVGAAISLVKTFDPKSLFSSLPGMDGFTAIPFKASDFLSITTLAIKDLFGWEVFDFDVSEYVNIKKLHISELVDGLSGTVSSAASTGKEAISGMVI